MPTPTNTPTNTPTATPTNTSTVIHYRYLPLVLREYPALPDLVITGLIATADRVEVVIRNQGAGSVMDEFWIDFYFDPHPPPAAVNEVWHDGRSCQGIAWAISNGRDPAVQPLPLLPGQSFTVTFRDAFVEDSYTWFAFPLPPGVAVYAQVDSIDLLTRHGGVLETHEARGGTYNNVFGPVSVPGAAQQTAPCPADHTDRQRSTWPLSLPKR